LNGGDRAISWHPSIGEFRDVRRLQRYRKFHLFEEIVDTVVGVCGQPSVALRERADEDIIAVVKDAGGRRRLTARVRDTNSVHVCTSEWRVLPPLSSLRLCSVQKHQQM